jgi:hypothetical protein
MTIASELSAEDAAVVQREWQRRVEAEYRSAVTTHALALWLLQQVAPFELVRLALRIVDDELAHSELSQLTYLAAGGAEPLHLPRETLGSQSPPLAQREDAILQCALRSFCLGETVAVRLFARLRSQCEQPQAKVALDRILKDEVNHREFGWTLLEWLLAGEQGEALRQRSQVLLPQMFAELRKSYAFETLARDVPSQPARRHWGLMPLPDYAAALLETYEKDYIPLFAALDIDAERAWKGR